MDVIFPIDRNPLSFGSPLSTYLGLHKSILKRENRCPESAACQDQYEVTFDLSPMTNFGPWKDDSARCPSTTMRSSYLVGYRSRWFCSAQQSAFTLSRLDLPWRLLSPIQPHDLLAARVNITGKGLLSVYIATLHRSLCGQSCLWSSRLLI